MGLVSCKLAGTRLSGDRCGSTSTSLAVERLRSFTVACSFHWMTRCLGYLFEHHLSLPVPTKVPHHHFHYNINHPDNNKPNLGEHRDSDYI